VFVFVFVLLFVLFFVFMLVYQFCFFVFVFGSHVRFRASLSSTKDKSCKKQGPAIQPSCFNTSTSTHLDADDEGSHTSGLKLLVHGAAASWFRAAALL
jgi:hypothetical protein